MHCLCQKNSHTRIFGVFKYCFINPDVDLVFWPKVEGQVHKPSLPHLMKQRADSFVALKLDGIDGYNVKQSCTKSVRQYHSNDIAYLLSVDHGIMHCSEHRTGLVLFGYSVLIFFSSVALRCRISVAVCGSNFRRMRSSARVTDNGCGPDIFFIYMYKITFNVK